jgi:hypothetical protein
MHMGWRRRRKTPLSCPAADAAAGAAGPTFLTTPCTLGGCSASTPMGPRR